MSAPLLYSLAGLLCFVIGLRGLIVYGHLLRKALALNVMSTGIFMFLVALAGRAPGGVPDPVPHAMVLTGIVVAVSATAILLTLVTRLHAVTGRVDGG
jgi:multicomponent Na+:H+ antiporter subunit C